MAKTATIRDHKEGLTAEDLLLTGTGGQVEVIFYEDDEEGNPIEAKTEPMVDTIEEAEVLKTAWENS
tara:strand:+ start:310 stop:510 length:201 start_codon:yes stop_codon:yes gene_type:complete